MKKKTELANFSRDELIKKVNEIVEIDKKLTKPAFLILNIRLVTFLLIRSMICGSEKEK